MKEKIKYAASLALAACTGAAVTFAVLTLMECDRLEKLHAEEGEKILNTMTKAIEEYRLTH